MRGNDISGLSYKELQALALKYGIPGNIKKAVLIRILRAAKGGNRNEVARLLTELKQTRKKRTRKSKLGKLNLTSTPLHSPNYTMEDCYHPPQQPPYQWVGAEEEIASREEESDRVPPYEEFRQFLLRRIQRECQNYDSNNNDAGLPSSVMDLRTVVTEAPALNPVSFDPTNHKSNIPAFVEPGKYMQSQSNNQVSYQLMESSRGSTRDPTLLERMLQAPAGANLGEIASPEPVRGSRVWSLEYETPNNPLDSSDTLTAESQCNGNDDNWQNDANYCHLVNNVRDQIFLNQPHPIDKNVPNNGNFSSGFPIDNAAGQCQYTYPNAGVQQNCQKWVTANALEVREPNYLEVTGNNNARTFHTVYIDESGGNYTDSRPANNEQAHYQYQVNNDMAMYGLSQNTMDMHLRDELQFHQNHSAVPEMQSDSADLYYSQQMLKQTGDVSGMYFKPVHSMQYDTLAQNVYTPTVQQMHTPPQQEKTAPNIYYQKYTKASTSALQPSDVGNMQSGQCNSGYFQQYNIAHNSQQSRLPTPAEGVQNQQTYGEVVAVEEESANLQKDFGAVAEETQSRLNGTLDPYWPAWSRKNSSDLYLENILNLPAYKYVDYSKMDQTSCVYCYTAPIVSQRPVSSNFVCSQKKRFVAERRTHTFSANWLLYNDTAMGMRMAKVRDDAETQLGECSQSMNAKRDAAANLEIAELIENDDSITNMFIRDYTNVHLNAWKNRIDSNVVLSEDLDNGSLFSTESTESRASEVNSIGNDQQY